MPDIRYVCLSDTHFGARGSLLTRLHRSGRRPSSENPILDALLACLRSVIAGVNGLGTPPTLVLNGDILELALAETPLALGAFEEFLKRAMPPGARLFSDVLFIPGNHDHHLWETAREARYTELVASAQPDEQLERPRHTTDLFAAPGDRPVQHLLAASARRLKCLGPGSSISAAYPNFALHHPASGRCVIFHHGHFIETVYRAMSVAARIIFPDLPPVATIERLELENFAWIDFLWSELGRSGAAGEGMATLYEARADGRKLKRILRRAAAAIARDHLDTGLPDWAEEHVLRWIFHGLVDQMQKFERNRPRTVLSADASAGLKDYVRRFVAPAVPTEARDSGPTFVFGHTHKPFTRTTPLGTGMARWLVLNTGGWVIDAAESSPQRGASAVLIDSSLNAVNLRLFNEGSYRPHVEDAGEAPALAASVAAAVEQHPAEWETFGKHLRRGVAARRRGRSGSGKGKK